MLHATQLHRHQNDITKVLYLTMERGRMVRMRRRSLEFHVQHLPSTTDRQQLSWHFISPSASVTACLYVQLHTPSLTSCHRWCPPMSPTGSGSGEKDCEAGSRRRRVSRGPVWAAYWNKQTFSQQQAGILLLLFSGCKDLLLLASLDPTNCSS